jgi:S1-C subfamily serine protease
MRLWLLLALVLAGCGGGAPTVGTVRVGHEVATGFPVGDGRVLTVAHVLAAGRPVSFAGRPARVRSIDRRLDVAILEADVHGDVCHGAAHAGEAATVLTVAGAVRVTVRRTITAHIDGAARPALELTGAVQPGDSGSPVLDRGGRLLGVVFAQSARSAGRVYAVDARALAAPLGA